MRPSRLRGFSYIGPRRYFLTACTFERRHCFTIADLVAGVECEFLRTAAERDFILIAYCFMPDHLHMLAEGTSASSDLCAFINEGKQRSAHSARSWLRGRLWQPGYYEHVLRSDEKVIEVARYIVQNPVRAGLVKTPLEYPFLGSQTLQLKDLVESSMWSPRRS